MLKFGLSRTRSPGDTKVLIPPSWVSRSESAPLRSSLLTLARDTVMTERVYHGGRVYDFDESLLKLIPNCDVNVLFVSV